MRIIFTLQLVFFGIIGLVYGQHVIPSPEIIPPHLHLTKVNSNGAGETPSPRPPATFGCTDTVTLAVERNTGLRGLTLDPITSASAVGMYFEAPQPMTIHGFDFYAWQSEGTDDTVAVSCAIYNAGIDSLPIGPPLMAVAVEVDSVFSGGVLTIIRKSAVFPGGVAVTGPYVLTVENADTNSISVVTNDWATDDGQDDWYAMAIIGLGWTHGYDVSIGIDDFNCDVAYEPYIEYDLNVDYSLSDTCLISADTIHFTNVSPSPILGSKMYNRHVLNSTPELAYSWDFGDGSAVVNDTNASHYFATPAGYPVTLTHEMNGYMSVCQADTMIAVGGPASADISVLISGLNLIGNTGTSTGAATYLWDFGDGGTSTEANPVYSYATGGDRLVCLTISNPCATDSACTYVSSCAPPVASFGYIIASGTTVAFTDGSTSTGTISSWNWTFGDGASSTDVNPVHTYATGGTYIVCLNVEDECLEDSDCESIDLAVGIEDDLANEWIHIWPQPAKDRFSIEFEGKRMEEISLYDLSGRQFSTKSFPGGTSKTEIKTSDIASGIYILELVAEGRVYRKRIILE